MADVYVGSVYAGMDLDADPTQQPPGTHREMLNGIAGSLSEFGTFVSNEPGTSLAVDLGVEKCVGYHHVEERNSIVFFTVDGGASALKLYNYDDDSVVEIARDTDFGCDWEFANCRWIGPGHSTSKPIAPCNDLILYWSSGYEYYWINVDEQLRGHSNQTECDDFKLFPPTPGAVVQVASVDSGGTDLAPGPYYVAARFYDEAGNRTNFSHIEGPVFLGSETNDPSDGTVSRGSILIKVDSPNARYSGTEIAVIPPAGDAPAGDGWLIYSGGFNSGGVSAVYHSTGQHIQVVSGNEIRIKRNLYLRGENLIQEDGKLRLYRTLQRKNLNYQRHTANIRLRYGVYAVPVQIAHKFKSLPRGENLNFSIQFKYTDQTHSVDFHIEGPQAGGNVLGFDCDVPPGQVVETASRSSTFVNYRSSEPSYRVTPGIRGTRREGLVQSGPDAVSDNPTLDPNVSQELVQENIVQETDQIQSTADDITNCQHCNEDVAISDLNKNTNIIKRGFENVTDLFKTDEEAASDPSQNKATTIKEAMRLLYDEAVKDADLDEEVDLRTRIVQSGGGNLNTSAGSGSFSGGALSFGTTTFISSRNLDCSIQPAPQLIAIGDFGGYESSLTYPTTKDCDGNYLYTYAGQPIRFFKTPYETTEPLFASAQTGVETRFDPSNIPGADAVVYMLGLIVENVYIPTDEELPLPLDKNEPFRINWTKREEHNSSKIAMGYLTYTGTAQKGGKTYAVPTNASNSRDIIDKHIDNDGSRLGSRHNRPLYMFHSPDTATTDVVPNADYLVVTGWLSGTGHRYHLYDEVAEPESDKVNKLDRRGCRSASNFSTVTPAFDAVKIKGITRAEFDSTVQPDTNISLPLLNKARESAVYIETEVPLISLPGGNYDESFIADGLEHEAPISNVKAWQVSLYRLNKSQYGSLENIRYANLGLRGLPLADNAGGSYVRTSGLVGDVSVGKWSHKRTAFISDKVGNYLNEDYTQTATSEFLGPVSARSRGVCDPPNRRGWRMKEFLGFWNPQRLPATGDKKDPKNMANAYPTLSNAAAVAAGGPITDLYYWRTLTHLNHLFVESRVHLKYRITGTPESRDVFYENLKGLALDTTLGGAEPEEAWLSDFHCVHKQPSQKQRRMKEAIRTFICVVLPMIMLGGVAGMDSPMDVSTTMLVSPAFVIMWLVLVYNVLTPKKIDDIIGAPKCRLDNNGAQDENCLRGLRDNVSEYSWGFSNVNTLNTFIGMPHPYNTCDCDGRGEPPAIQNTIYTSNIQNPESSFDAYRNFQANAYTALTQEKGTIQRLFVWNSKLYADTTDGRFLLQKRSPAGTDGEAFQYLGEGDLYPIPIMIQDGTMGGFAGNQDPNSLIVTKFGVVSVDAEANRIYIYDEGFNDLSSLKFKMSKFLDKNMPFLGTGDRDQMSSEGSHYTFGYDPVLERLLITKHDSGQAEGASWTLSFDLTQSHYRSFHSYVPEFYFWNRKQLFSVKDGKVYRHLQGGYTNYYGEQHPFFVTTVVAGVSSNNNTRARFDLHSMLLDTEINDGNLRNIRQPADRLLVWNDRQTWGWTNLVQKDKLDLNEATSEIAGQTFVEYEDKGMWALNFARDYIESDGAPPVIYPNYGFDIQPNISNINQSETTWTSARKFNGKYAQAKLEFTDSSKQIKVFNVLGLTSRDDINLITQ